MYNSKNVDPAKQKENTFELYSVPVFPTNTPEIIKGEKFVSNQAVSEQGGLHPNNVDGKASEDC